MKAYGELKTSLHAYMILAPDIGESLLHTPAALPLGKKPQGSWLEGWVFLSANLDILWK
jgi:hypothetical protein